MKFTIETAALRGALKKCALVTERRRTIPVLSFVKIEAHHDEIVITATDLERVLTLRVDGSGTGSALVHLQTLRGIVDKASGTLTGSVENETLTLAADKGRFTVDAMDPDEWPTFAHGKAVSGFKINAQELGWGLERCEGSICKEETRLYLCGVFLHWGTFRKYTGLACAATDGHRLTRAQLPECSPIGKAMGPEKLACIVPRKSVHVLVRLITPGPGDDRETYDDEVKVRQSDTGRLDIEAETWRLSTKCIDGTFPDYTKIFDGLGKPSSRFTVDTADLAAALKRLKAMRGGTVTVQIPGDGNTHFHAKDEGVEACETIEGATVGPASYVGLKLENLTHVAAMADGPEITAAYTDPSSPVLFDMPDHGGHLLHLIMPVRVEAPEAVTVNASQGKQATKRLPPPPPPSVAAKPKRKPPKAATPAADIKGEFIPVK